MAKRTRDPDARDVSVIIELRAHAHHRVLPQQFLRTASRKWIVYQKLEQVQPIHVDFETQTERFQWLDVLLHDFVELRCIRPEPFVAKGFVAEDLLALLYQIVRRLSDWKLMACRHRPNDERQHEAGCGCP